MAQLDASANTNQVSKENMHKGRISSAAGSLGPLSMTATVLLPLPALGLHANRTISINGKIERKHYTVPSPLCVSASGTHSSL